jgi:class 3 adenylate cyclase
VEAGKSDIVRRYTKYIFLDVVQFSNRSAEAQSDIVHQLNNIVRHSLETYEISGDDCILLPTGDGMCIALISPSLVYDIHIQVALKILSSLDKYNKATVNRSRQFQVRIGIDQNTDILVMDINERKNIAGAGINMASRIMDKADGGHILVSQTVYNELQPSEQYMDHFNSFNARGKHNLNFRVYQYIDDFYIGLNLETPTEFVTNQPSEPRLSRIAAFYLAHSIRLKQFIINKQGSGQSSYSLIVLLWFLAMDSKGTAEATDISPYAPCIYGDGKLDINTVFDYYNSQDFWVINLLTHFISSELSKFYSCLYLSGGYQPIFVSDEGKQKLKRDWPSIWDDFELDKCS